MLTVLFKTLSSSTLSYSWALSLPTKNVLHTWRFNPMLLSRTNLYLWWEAFRNSGLISRTSFYTFLATILLLILPPVLVTGFLPCSQDGHLTYGLLAHLLGPVCISVIGMSSASSGECCLHRFWVPYSGGGLYSLALHQFREEHTWNLCQDCRTSPLAPEFPASALLPLVRQSTGSPKP